MRKIAPVGFLLVMGCGSSGSAPGSPDGGVVLDDGGWVLGTSDASVEGGPSFDAGADAAPSITCTGKPGAPGDSTVTLTSSGIARVFLLHVPASYDASKGAMLVFNFHGFTSDALQEQLLTNMNASSDAHGYVAVYPYGIAQSWNAGACCGTATATNVDDIQFIRDMLGSLQTDFCIDPKRIYATGMSNGGFMSHRIGCEMSDTFAAIAPVAGVIGMPSCTPTRPVPVIHFHGTADPLVPYTGSASLGFMSVPDSIAEWRTNDGCSSASSTIYSKGDATCVAWSACNAGSEVVLCTIDQGGHTWPGGLPIPFGKTSTDISATDTMIDFFQAHPMP
jgi:polyhydroxybutyrate depolymerase